MRILGYVHAHFTQYKMDELLGMTVGRIYAMFDDFAAYVRLTNPWGDGEENETRTIEPCKKCGEVEFHKADCPMQGVPDIVGNGIREHRSGFDFGAKAASSGLAGKGVDVKTLSQVQAQDPELASLIGELSEES